MRLYHSENPGFLKNEWNGMTVAAKKDNFLEIYDHNAMHWNNDNYRCSVTLSN